MKKLMAGPDGVVQPDQVIQVSEEEGKALISGGFAVPYRKAPETATMPTPEMAALVEIAGKRATEALARAGFTTLDELQTGLEGGLKLTDVKGIGRKSAAKILKSLAELE